MAIKAKILKITTNSKLGSYEICHEVYEETRKIYKNEFSFRVRTVHDYYFSSLRILLREKEKSNSYMLYTEIPFRNFKVGETDMSCPLFDAASKDEYHSYELQPREEKGKVYIIYTYTEESFDSCLHTGHEPNFIDKIFNLLFVNDNEIKVSVILKKALELTRGTVRSKINTFRGWLELQNYYRTKSISQSLENISDVIKNLSSHTKSSLKGYGNTSTTESIDRSNSTVSFISTFLDAKEDLPNYKGFMLLDKKFYAYFKNILYYALAPYGAKLNNFAIPLRRNTTDKNLSDTTKNILNLLDIPASDLISVNLDEKDKKSSFIIFLYKESLVLSFRGTVNPRDISFDLKFEYSEFYEGCAHDGIKRLGKSFIKEHWHEVKSAQKRYQRPNLIVTGHSLGGSIALMVGYIAIREKLIDNDNIEIVAYAPAPIMSKNLMRRFDNIINFTYSNDIVPLLSYGTVCDLKYLCCSLGTHLEKIKNNEEDLGKLIEKVKIFCLEKDIYPKLYIPGKIVQFKTFFTKDKNLFFRFLNTFGWKSAKLMKEKVVLAKAYDYKFSEHVIFDQSAIINHIPRFLFDSFDQSIQICEYIEDINS